MSVLRYKDPATGQWVDLAMGGGGGAAVQSGRTARLTAPKAGILVPITFSPAFTAPPTVVVSVSAAAGSGTGAEDAEYGAVDVTPNGCNLWVRSVGVGDIGVHLGWVAVEPGASGGGAASAPEVAGGYLGVSTDAQGNFTIPHGLGRKPAAVTLQVGMGTTPALIQIVKVLPSTWDDKTITGTAWRTDTNAVAGGQPLSVVWTAIGTG